MAKKYHIDDQNNVVVCSAFLRKCSRVDYVSKEVAYSVMKRKEAEDKLKQDIAEAERILRNTDVPSFLISADFSGDGFGKSVRSVAQKIDEAINVHGDEVLKKAYVSVPLYRKYVNNKKCKIRLSLDRIPTLDRDTGKIVSHWTLETEDLRYNRKLQPIVLEFNEDYDMAKERAVHTIYDAVARSVPYDFDEEYIQYETNYMMNQLEDAYAMIEEEIIGAFEFWDNNREIGTFIGCSMSDIYVDLNYHTTLFRGRTFDSLLNGGDSIFRYVSPEVNVQVYDNENGMSETSWRIVRYEGEWFLQTVDVHGEINPQKLSSADEGYRKMYDFVSTQMLSNAPKIAEEKACYVRDLMVEVEAAIAENSRIKDSYDWN